MITFRKQAALKYKKRVFISSPIPNEKPIHLTIPVKMVHVHAHRCIYSLDIHTHVEQPCPILYM